LFPPGELGARQFGQLWDKFGWFARDAAAATFYAVHRAAFDKDCLGDVVAAAGIGEQFVDQETVSRAVPQMVLCGKSWLRQSQCCPHRPSISLIIEPWRGLHLAWSQTHAADALGISFRAYQYLEAAVVAWPTAQIYPKADRTGVRGRARSPRSRFCMAPVMAS